MAIYLREYPKLIELQDEVISTPEFIDFCERHEVSLNGVKHSAPFITYIVTLYNYERFSNYDY